MYVVLFSLRNNFFSKGETCSLFPKLISEGNTSKDTVGWNSILDVESTAGPHINPSPTVIDANSFAFETKPNSTHKLVQSFRIKVTKEIESSERRKIYF